MRPGDVMFSDSVKRAQEERGSRAGYARVDENDAWKSKITADLAGFVAERESFYLATASADGRPYIQHRGGPKGFLKVLDEHTLAFADFAGNRQYVSTGNLDENDQAFIFLMDYPNRRRIKIWGRAEVVENDPALLEQLADPAYGAKLERVFRFGQTGAHAGLEVHLRAVAGDDHAGILAEPSERHEHLLAGGILRLVEDDE